MFTLGKLLSLKRSGPFDIQVITNDKYLVKKKKKLRQK